MATLTLVVGGAPALAQALQRTAYFKAVHSVATTGELRQLVANPTPEQQLPSDPREIVFLFADTMPSDQPPSLGDLVRKLATSGRKVVVLGATPNARDLVAASPAAGLLEGPFHMNLILGAISGLGLGMLDPVSWGGEEFNPFSAAYEPAAAEATQAPAWGGWGNPAPSAPTAPSVDPVTTQGPVAETPAPAAAPGGWGAPESDGWGQPQQPAPADTGWGAPQEPAPADAGWGQPQESAPSDAGWGQPQEPDPAPAVTGWGTPPAEPPSDTPAAPAGWGAPPDPVAAPTPAVPTPADPVPAPVAQTTEPAAPVAPSGWGESSPATSGPLDPAARPRLSLAAAAQPQPDTGTDVTAPAGWGAPQPAEPQPSGGLAQLAGTGWGAGPDGYGQEPGPAVRGGFRAQHEVSTKRRGHAMVVTSPKGGVGKTSLSLNLAAVLGMRLKQEGKTVCLIDANFQQADTGKLLDAYRPNITHIARDKTLLDRDRIAESLIHRPDLNLSVLLGPARPQDANPMSINAALYTEALTILRELYDYIIIDTPVAELYHDIFSGFALPSADYLIIPVAPNLATLVNADQWLRAICQPKVSGGSGLDENRIGILLNRAQPDVDCDPEDVMRELSSWHFIGQIPETPRWQKALNNNEIVATWNYEEINQPLAGVLFAATGEQSLLDHSGQLSVTEETLTSKLKRLVSPRKRN